MPVEMSFTKTASHVADSIIVISNVKRKAWLDTMLRRKINLHHYSKLFLHCEQNTLIKKTQNLDVNLRQNRSLIVIWKEKVTASARTVST